MTPTNAAAPARALALSSSLALALAAAPARAQSADAAEPTASTPPWTAYYAVPAPATPAPTERADQLRTWALRIEADAALGMSRASSATPGAASNGANGATFGVSAAVMLSPHLMLGLSHLGVGYSSVTGFNFTAAPFVEYSLRFGRRWEPYAQVGIVLEAQFRNGAVTGAAGFYAGTGVRYYVTDWMWIGAGVRAYAAATDNLHVGGGTLARGDTLVTAGLELGFRF